jgi:queuine tRNA-ribosyltransferase
MRNGSVKASLAPIEEGCGCYACRHFSRAYVRHLLNVNEVLGIRLLTIHNLFCYNEFIKEVRAAIRGGTFSELRAQCREIRATTATF